ncbi:hypothetical protein J6590_035365 [Homalodisca vitripennis]|nr:hypothetical protein J6590_035365 [Homalodisca vitripennis]
MSTLYGSRPRYAQDENDAQFPSQCPAECGACALNLSRTQDLGHRVSEEFTQLPLRALRETDNACWGALCLVLTGGGQGSMTTRGRRSGDNSRPPRSDEDILTDVPRDHSGLTTRYRLRAVQHGVSDLPIVPDDDLLLHSTLDSYIHTDSGRLNQYASGTAAPRRDQSQCASRSPPASLLVFVHSTHAPRAPLLLGRVPTPSIIHHTDL